MKKLKSMLLLLGLLVSQVALGLSPDGWVDKSHLSIGGVRYTLSSGEATVVQVEADVQEALVIPATIYVQYGPEGQEYTPGNFNVTKIADGAFAGTQVASLALGEQVKTLEAGAFRGAVALKKVYFVRKTPPTGLSDALLPLGVEVMVPAEGVDAYHGKLASNVVFPLPEGLLLVSTPTGHGQVVALLGGKPISNIYPFTGQLEKLRLIARVDARYQHGAWSDNGMPVAASLITPEETAHVQYYDNTGLEGYHALEVKFEPRRAAVHWEVLPSDSWTLSADNKLVHEAGGTIVPPAVLVNNGDAVPNGSVVEFKAEVDGSVKAEQADGSQVNIWAVAEWRVNGQVVRDANGAVLTSATYRHILDGPARVAVKFKRTYYKLVAKYYGYQGEPETYLWTRDTVAASTEDKKLAEGQPLWRRAGLEAYIDIYGYAMAGTCNGRWLLPSQTVEVREDMYLELWRMRWSKANGAEEDVSSVALLVAGPGKLKVTATGASGSAVELHNGDPYEDYATLNATVEYDKDKARLVSFTLWGTDLPTDGYELGGAIGTKKFEAVFAPKGGQVLMLTNQGGVALKVTRLEDNKQLHTGDLLYRGDKLKIHAYRYGNNEFTTQSYELVALRVNGTSFRDNDVYTVGSEDVHVLADVSNFQTKYGLQPILNVKITGEGYVDLQERELLRNEQGLPVDRNGRRVYVKSNYVYDYYQTYSGWYIYVDNDIIVTPRPAPGYVLKKLLCNGKDITYSYDGVDKWNKVKEVSAGHVQFPIEAVFVKRTAISLFTEVMGPGYIRVDDLTSGQSLREGDELTPGHLLRISAESTNNEYYARAITVNGFSLTSGDTYVVRPHENVRISAHIDRVQNQNQIVLYKSVTGKGTLRVFPLSSRKLSYESGQILNQGDFLWYEAKPASGYELARVSFGARLASNMRWDRWMVDDTPKNLVVEANFVPIGQRLLTIYTTGHGLLEVYRNGEKLRRGDGLQVGDKLTFRVQPDVGNRLVTFSVNGAPMVAENTYEVATDDAEVRVDAEFAGLKQPVLVYRINGRGGIVVAWKGAQGTDSYASGISLSEVKSKSDVLWIRLQSDKASKLASFTINGVKQRDVRYDETFSYQITSWDKDIVISATFLPKSASVPSLAIYTTPGGIVKVEKDGLLYKNGDRLELPRSDRFDEYKITAVADSGYRCASLTLDGDKFESGATTENARLKKKSSLERIISAVFEPLEYDFKVSFLGDSPKNGVLHLEINADLSNPATQDFDSTFTHMTVAYGTRLRCTYGVSGGGAVAHAMIKVTKPESKAGYFVRPGEVFTMPHEKVEIACIVTKPHSVPLLFGFRGTGKGTVTVTKEGSTTAYKNGDILQRGDRIKVECKADQGSRFLSVTVNGHAYKATPFVYEVKDEGKVLIEAVFAKDEGAEFGVLTYRVEGVPDAATITVRNGERECLDGLQVRKHDELTVRVDLKDYQSYRLVSLQVNGQPLQNGKSYFADGDVEVVATVAKKGDQVLLLTETGMGEVQVERNRERIFGGAKLYPGDLLRLKSEPLHGFRLVSLQVNGRAVSDGYEYTVGQGDVTIVGVFAGVNQTVLSLISSMGGSIVVTRDNQRLNSGAPIAKDQELTIRGVAQNGYELVSLQVAGSSFESGDTYKIAEDGKDLLVKAYFAPVGSQELVILVKGPAGSVEVREPGSDVLYMDGTFLTEGTPLSIATMAPNGINCTSLKVNGDASPFRPGNNGQMVGEYTVQKGKHVRLEAEFSDKSYTLNWKSSGSGSADVYLRGVQLTQQPAKLSYGDEVTIRPNPQAGNRFYGIFDDQGHKLPGLSYRMGERDNVTLTIQFVREDDYIVSWETKPQAGGTLVLLRDNGEPLREAIGTQVRENEKLTVTAGASAGYQFYSLEQNGEPKINGSVCTVTEKSTHFVAEFIPEDKTVVHVKISQGGTAALSVYGVGTPVHDGSLVETGNAIIVKTKPDAGYELEGIFVDGVKIDDGGNFQAKGAEVYVDIKFRQPLPAGKYRLTTNVTGEGSIQVTGPSGYNYLDGAILDKGTVLTITAHPAPGYETVSFKVNGADFTNGAPHTVNADVLVQAKYEVPKQYRLTANVVDTDGKAIGGATVTAKGSGSMYTLRADKGKYSVVLPPDTYKVTATANAQSRTLTVVVEDADQEVTLRLGKTGAKQYKLTLEPKDGQIVARTGNGVVADGGALYEGDALTFEVVPATGKRFVKMEVNSDAHDPSQPWIVKGDVKVKGYFVPEDKYLLSIEHDGPGQVKVLKGGTELLDGATISKGDVLTVTTEVTEPVTNMRTEFSVKGASHKSGDEYTVVEDVVVSAKFEKRPTYAVTIEVVDENGNTPSITSTYQLTSGKLPDGTVYPMTDPFESGMLLPDGEYTLVTTPRISTYQVATTPFRVSGAACTVKVTIAEHLLTLTVNVSRKDSGPIAPEEITVNGQPLTPTPGITGTYTKGLLPGSYKLFVKADADEQTRMVEMKGEAQTVDVVFPGIPLPATDYFTLTDATKQDGKLEFWVSRKAGGYRVPSGAKVAKDAQIEIVGVPNATDKELYSVIVNGQNLPKNGAQYLYQVKANTEAEGIFGAKVTDPDMVRFSMSYTAGGTLTVTDQTESRPPLAKADQVKKGHSLMVVAVPDAAHGYALKELRVNGKLIDNNSTITADEDIVVTAVFGSASQSYLTIAYRGDGAGELKVNDGTNYLASGVYVEEGKKLTFKPMAASGSVFSQMYINGTLWDVALPWIVKSGEDVAIEVFFDKGTAPVCRFSQEVHGSGTLVVTREGKPLVNKQVINKGDKLQVMATPDASSRLVRLLRNGSEDLSNGAQVTVEGNEHIAATFGLIAPVDDLYDVTIAYQGTGKGLLKVTVDGQEYTRDFKVKSGKKLEFTPVSNADSKFYKLLVNGRELEPTEGYTVNGEAVNLTAVFVLLTQTQTLTYSAVSKAGSTISVTRNGKPLANGAAIAANEELVVASNAQGGESLLDLRANNHDILSTSSYKVPDNKNVHIVGTFGRPGDLYLVNVEIEGEGTVGVAVNGSKVLLPALVKTGDKVKLTPVAGTNYELFQLYINDVPWAKDDEYTVANQKVVVRAKFVRKGIKHILNVTTKGNGKVTVKVGNDTIHSGDALPENRFLDVTAEPKGSDKLKQLTIAGVECTSYKVDDSSPKVVEVFAYFASEAEQHLFISYQPNGGMGTVTVTCDGNPIDDQGLITGGQELRFKQEPASDCQFVELLVNGISHQVEQRYTVPATGDVKVVAIYKKDVAGEYTLVASKQGEGTLKVGGEEVGSTPLVKSGLITGAEFKVETTPAAGQELKRLLVNGHDFPTDGTVKVENEDIRINAHFGPTNTPTLTVGYEGNGLIEVFNAQGKALASGDLLKTGDMLTFKVTETDPTYKFFSLQINGRDFDINGTYEVGSGDVRVTGIFIPKAQKLTLTYAAIPAEGGKVVVKRGSDVLANGAALTKGQNLTVALVATPAAAGSEPEYKSGVIFVNNQIVFDTEGKPDKVCNYQVKDESIKVVGIFRKKNDSWLLSIKTVGDGEIHAYKVDGGKEYRLYPQDPLQAGDTVRFKAVPGATTRFAALEISGVDHDITQVYEMPRNDIEVVGYFEPVNATDFLYRQQVTGEGKLTVTCDGKGLTSGDRVQKGDLLTVKAEPKAGYTLIYLDAEGARLNMSATDTTMVVGDRNILVKAVFAKADERWLIDDTQRGGKILAYDVSVDPHARVYPNTKLGEKVTLLKFVAKPDAGMELTVLLVNKAAQAIGATYTVPQQGNVRYEGHFRKLGQNDQKTLLMVQEGHGTLVVKNGQNQLSHGDYVINGAKLTITATPAAGYTLRLLTAGGQKAHNGDQVSVNTSDATYTVYALFEPESAPQQLLTLTYAGDHVGCKVEVTNNNVPVASEVSPIKDRDKLHFTPAPATGKQLAQLLLNHKPHDVANDYVVHGTESVDAVAIFNKEGASKNVLYAEAIGGGIVDVSADGGNTFLSNGAEIAKGQKLLIFTKADFGYKLEKLVINDVSVASEAGKYEHTVVADAPLLIYAYFEQIDKYSIAAEVRNIETMAALPSVWKIAQFASGNWQEQTMVPDTISGKGTERMLLDKSKKYRVTVTPIGYSYSRSAVVDTLSKDETLLFKFSSVQDVKTHALWIKAAEHGTVKVLVNGNQLPEGEGVLVEGDLLAFEPVPEMGYELATLLVNDLPLVAYKMGYQVGDEDVTITPIFVPNGQQRTLVISAMPSEAVSRITVTRGGTKLESGAALNEGQELTITADNAAGDVKVLTVNGAEFTSGNTYTVQEKDQVVTVFASFSKQPQQWLTVNYPSSAAYNDLLSVYKNGASAPQPIPSLIKEGDFLTFQATPDAKASPARRLLQMNVDGVPFPVQDTANVGTNNVHVDAFFATTGKNYMTITQLGEGTVKVSKGSTELTARPIELDGDGEYVFQLKSTTPFVLSSITINGVESKPVSGYSVKYDYSMGIGDVQVVVVFTNPDKHERWLLVSKSSAMDGDGQVVTRNAQGKRVLTPCKISEGEVYSFKAKPNDASFSVGLQIEGENYPEQTNYEVPALTPEHVDVHVVGLFALSSTHMDKAVLLITQVGQGNVTVKDKSGNLVPNHGDLKRGAVYNFTAAAASTYVKKMVTVAGRNYLDSSTFLVPNEQILHLDAVFGLENECNIYVTYAGSGKGAVNVKREAKNAIGLLESLPVRVPGVVAPGSVLTFEAVPDAGSTFVQMFINGKPYAPGYKHTAVEGEDVRIEAIFNDPKVSLGAHVLAIATTGKGTLTVTREGESLKSGDLVNTADALYVKAEPVKPSTRALVQVLGAAYSNDTVTVGNANVTIQATFTDADTRFVTYRSIGEKPGEVQIAINGTPVLLPSVVKTGDELTFPTWTCAEGRLVKLFVNGEDTDPTATYTVQEGTEDVQVTGYFVERTARAVLIVHKHGKEGTVEFKVTQSTGQGSFDVKEYDQLGGNNNFFVGARLEVTVTPADACLDFCSDLKINGEPMQTSGASYLLSNEVLAQEELVVDVTFAEAPRYQLKFGVKDTENHLVNGATVNIAGKCNITESISNYESGKLTDFSVLEGNYNVIVTCPGYERFEQLFYVDKDNTVITVTLKPEKEKTPVEQAALAAVAIYPNPVADKLNVLHLEEVEQLVVYTVRGEELLRLQTLGQQEMVVPVGTLPEGTYMLQVECHDAKRVLPFVVAR